MRHCGTCRNRQPGDDLDFDDADRGVVVGATCVGPQADAWGAELALAIRARVDLRVLCDRLRAFPTWSEGITATLDNLTQDDP